MFDLTEVRDASFVAIIIHANNNVSLICCFILRIDLRSKHSLGDSRHSAEYKDNDDNSVNEIELLYCTYNGCMPICNNESRSLIIMDRRRS